MFNEISEWFANDLKKHNIETELIKEAKDAGLNYAVFKNWHQPTPTRREIEPMYGPNDIWHNRLQLTGCSSGTMMPCGKCEPTC